MTLVVGYADENIGFLVADSLLTPAMPHIVGQGPVAGEFHGLKIQIVDPNIAIAFAASDSRSALDVIRSLKLEEKNDDIAHRLLGDYQRANSKAAFDCEFLVLQIKERHKTLAHVTREGFLNCQRAYLGDQSRYKELKNLLDKEAKPRDGAAEFEQVSNGMKSLVQQRKGNVGAIAGCIVRVVDARISRTLEYLQEVEHGLLPWEGITGYSLLASNSPQRGIGIYYLGGKFGYIMIVGDTEDLRKEAADSIQEFIAKGKRKYGLNLEGGTW